MELDRLEEVQDTGPDWSVSRIHTIMTCGKRYHYKYIEKIEEPKTVPLAFGSAIHKCNEIMHLKKVWGDALIEALWEKEWSEAQEGINWFATNYRKSLWDAKGLKILLNYRDKHQDDVWYALEANFRYRPDDGFPFLRGTFDKVQRLTEHPDVPPQFVGRLAVIDYKTGKNPPTPVMVASDPQLTIYHDAAYQILKEDVVLGLHHLPTDKIYWTTRVPLLHMTPVFDMLSNGLSRVASQEFDRNIDWHCKYCPYMKDCLGSLNNFETIIGAKNES